MKYEIDISKSEMQTLTIEAASPTEAYLEAKKAHPGWQISGELTEVINDDAGDQEYGEEFSLNGTCDLCDKVVWRPETMIHDEEGCTCMECVKALAASEGNAERRGPAAEDKR